MIPYKPNASFHAAFFVAASDRHWARFKTIVSGEAQQGGIEADRIAASFQNRTLEIIVEQDTRNTLPCFEAGDVAAQKVLHAGIEEEAQEDLTRVAQHHDERHQRTACPADFEMAEMTPVDLCLFARQRAQTQIGFGFRTRPILGDQMPEVIGTARIAAFAHHRIETAGGQRRECFQRLADERQIGVDPRGTRRSPKSRQAGLGQHAPHDAVVDVQLTGDGADRPLLGVIEAQDLGLDVRRCHHGWVPSGRVALQPVSAMAAAAQEPLAYEWRTPATAPMTVRDRSPGPILRSCCVARTHRRARRQQIIGGRWG